MLCPPLCGLLLYQEFSKGELSYKAKKERELICSRPLPLYSFATRFAGKEAIFKCFSVHGDTLRLIDIEILETPDGSPIVCLHGKAAELAARKGITNILLSLSYDTDYAVAYATAIAD